MMDIMIVIIAETLPLALLRLKVMRNTLNLYFLRVVKFQHSKISNHGAYNDNSLHLHIVVELHAIQGVSISTQKNFI